MSNLSAEGLVREFRRLKDLRLRQKEALRATHPPRQALSRDQRTSILEKTDARCHICGGDVSSERWQADHVLARSGGGAHVEDNYLPAHQLCNNYRWDYLSDEFQYILKLGVWARTQIEKNTLLGRQIAEKFSRYEARRVARRISPKK
jgi:5-methylcytosine-specific restriction endonuclease McrA